MNTYIEIGKTHKTRGVAGELKYSVSDTYWEDFLKAEVLFIDVSGLKTPFFVESVKTGRQEVLKLEDVDALEEAHALSNKVIFMRQSDLFTKKMEEEVPLTSMFDILPGYLMVDKKAGEIGGILEILEFPQQIMAVVQFGEKEILIPLNDSFIQEINQVDKKMLVELPEGLLDL